MTPKPHFWTRDSRSHHRRIAREIRKEVAMAEYHHRRCAVRVLAREKRAAM